MDKILLIRAVVKKADALLCVNGLVLCKLFSGKECRLPVHEFIHKGVNSIQVFLLTSVMVDCQVSLQVELQKDRGKAVFVLPQVLYAFSQFALRGDRLEKNCLLDVRVDLPVAFPRWRYLDVMQSDSDKNDTTKIHDFIFQLLRLMNSKKLTSLLPYFSVRNREVAAAYGLEMQQVHQSFQSHLGNLVATAPDSDAIWNSSSWRVHAIRHAAVYALLNDQYQPLFQFPAGEGGTLIQLPMHVGVLGGEVFVLR